MKMFEQKVDAQAWPYHDRIVDLSVIILLILAGMKLTYGLSDVLDLMMTDETGYITSGINIVKNGLPSPDWSPLYALWYYLLSFIARDPINLYYLNYKILSILLPVLIYVVLRVYQVHFSTAFVAAFLFLISRANLPGLPKPSHFALVIILTTFILAGLARSPVKIISIIILGTLLGSLVRPELFLSFLALLLAASFLLIKYRQTVSFRHDLIFGFIWVCAIFGIIVIFGLPISGGSDRPWFNFGQSFSCNYHYWHDTNLDPFENWSFVVQLTFGNAKTISQAFLNNPWIFLKHIFTNIFFYIANIFSIVFVHYNLILPPATKFSSILEGILAFAIILTYVIYYRKELLNNYYINKDIGYNYIVAWLIIVILIPLIISSMIMNPQPRLLTLQYGLMLIVCLIIFLGNTPIVGKNLERKELFLIAVIVLAVTPSICNNWYFANKFNTPKLDNVNTIKFIRKMGLHGQVNLLNATGDYRIYLGDNFKTVNNCEKKEKFTEFIRKYDINAIVIEANLLRSQFFVNDQEWLQFLIHFGDYGFKEFKVPNSDSVLLIKDNIS